jgi:hypothetical protein
MQMPQRFSIDQKVMEAAINYIASKPYKEVAQLIATINRDIRPINEPDGEVTPAPGQAQPDLPK